MLAGLTCTPVLQLACYPAHYPAQTTLGLVVLWLVWPCALWCAAWLLVEWRSRTHAAARAAAGATSSTTTGTAAV